MPENRRTPLDIYKGMGSGFRPGVGWELLDRQEIAVPENARAGYEAWLKMRI